MFKEFQYKLQIKESHLDSFGHVNNATYMQLFEQARWEIITPGGYGLSEVLKYRQGPIVLESNIKFRKELNNREWVTIRSFNQSIKGKIMKMSHEIIKDNGDISAIAEFTFGFMDLNERKLISPPDRWLKAIGYSEN